MIHSQESIVDVLLAACERHGGRTAFTCMGADLSYRRLERLSRRFAAWLRSHSGLRPGDRIGIQLPNILQYPVVVLGALRAGLVVVNINPLYSASELAYQLNDAGARALVVLANTAAGAAEAVPATQVETVIVTQLGDLHGPLRGRALNFLARHIRKMVPACRFASQVEFRHTLGSSEGKGGSEKADWPQRPGNLALLQYTGGTTGVAKGAMLTHANLVANMHQLKQRLGDDCPRAGETMVAPLPLYHIYAFTIHMLYALDRGLCNLLIPNPRDISALVRTLKRYRISGFVGINSLYNALCGSSAFARLDFSRLRIACAGGMPLSAKTARRWQDLTGCPILEGYGLSEASPVVCANSAGRRQEGSIGHPLNDTEVKVVDPDGVALPPGEPGELCVRGPQVMQGYWRRPEETRQVVDGEGWLHTGDVAVIQPDGFLRIVDRIKDLIIVSGYNVFPAEIEDHVCRHPGVREAAAVGVRRGDIGEKVKLYVVAESDLTRRDIIDWCQRGLAPYKVPRLIEFRESLPKSTVGKILRRQLRVTEQEGAPGVRRSEYYEQKSID